MLGQAHTPKQGHCLLPPDKASCSRPLITLASASSRRAPGLTHLAPTWPPTPHITKPPLSAQPPGLVTCRLLL